MDKCGSCGREAHEDVSKCPAKGKECFECKKLNHFGNVRRSKGTESHSVRWKDEYKNIGSR